MSKFKNYIVEPLMLVQIKFHSLFANFLLALSTIIPTPGWSQSMNKDCSQYLQKGLYLKFYDCNGTGTDLISIHNRSIALSFLGKEQDAQLLFDRNDATSNVAVNKNKNWKPSVKQWKAHSAIPLIAKMASSYKIVMLNEAHHVSQHRLFALELAKELYKLGFTHLAVEGLTPPESGREVAKIDLDSGLYTSDPEFGYFLNEALAMGFQLIAYEAVNTDSIREREIGQAQNLKAFIDSNPGAKLFVYAGYAHITKNDSDKRKGWMAKELKLLTGIDPLSIDQVSGTPSPYKVLRDPVWLETQSSLLPGTPTVFSDGKGTLLSGSKWRGMVDFTVFYPESRLQYGRAAWLTQGRKRHIVKYTHDESTPVVIRARRIGDPKNIPVDQVMMTAGTNAANLFLPSGEYYIEKETLSTGVVLLYKLKM